MAGRFLPQDPPFQTDSFHSYILVFHPCRTLISDQRSPKAAGNIPSFSASENQLDGANDGSERCHIQTKIKAKSPVHQSAGRPPLYKNTVPQTHSPSTSPTERLPSPARGSAVRPDFGTPPLPHSVSEDENPRAAAHIAHADSQNAGLAESTEDFDVTLLPEVASLKDNILRGGEKNVAAAPATPPLPRHLIRLADSSCKHAWQLLCNPLRISRGFGAGPQPQASKPTWELTFADTTGRLSD